jgi:SAM-dependent methyltransferase
MQKAQIRQKYDQWGLERIPCNLCGADDVEVLQRFERFGGNINTVICRKCGLIYLNPRWSDDSYRKFYEADYRDLMGESEVPPAEMMQRQRIHGAQILDFCAPFLGRARSVLDIGCAAGGILAAFADAGDFRLGGVEPSHKHAEFVRSFGWEVYEGLFEDLHLQAESWDLAVMTQTLNHLLDPHGVMKAIREVLTPRGMFFVEVQNFPEHARRARVPVQVDHAYYFCAETLECMARRVGLEPIRCQVDTIESLRGIPRYMRDRSAPLHVRMLLRKAEPDPTAPLPNWRDVRRQVRRGFRAKGGMTFRIARQKFRLWKQQRAA